MHLLLHPHDEYISRYIRAHHCWEPRLTELITELIACLPANCDTHTFVDVGANLGYFSVWVASQPANLPVVALEPVHENLQLLRANVALNQLQPQVTILPFAAGCRGTRLTQFFVNTANMGVCSSVQLGLSSSTQWVQEVDLEDALRKEEVPRVHRLILKVDVEEQELDLLNSFSSTLWARMDVLILEVAAKHARQVLALLKLHFVYGLNMGEMLEAGTLHNNHQHLSKLESIESWEWDDVQRQTNVIVMKHNYYTRINV
jgi:FkbM family methyltransferase